MKLNKTVLLAMLFALICGFVKVAWAEEEDDLSLDQTGVKAGDFVKSRTYIGVVGISSTIDQNGGFNGTQGSEYGPVTYQLAPVTLWSNMELSFVPAITRNFGFGVLAGHRQGPWAMEVSFWRSDHTGTWTLNATTFHTSTTYQSINFDMKRYFFTQVPTQPFISVGFSLPWLWVKNGSALYDAQSGVIDNVPYSIDDETISGIGFNLGAGLEIYLGNGFSLVGGGYQRWTGFNQSNGAAKVYGSSIYFDQKPTDVGVFEGDGLNFYVGTTFGFQ